MDAQTFDIVIDEQMNRSRNMLTTKNGAYNPNEDKLHIFKRTAMLRGTTPQGALSGMMAKHTGSIYDMCESGKEYPIEVWNEKISDHINYLLLLRAVVEDQRKLTNSDEALAALRERLRGEPNVILHDQAPEGFHSNVKFGVENHVDEEIYTQR
jgi:hypothetical protein